jgi:hypothetical protein
VDARADVWSLGVIFYEMLSGTRPFAGESFALLSAAILRGTYAPVSELQPSCPPALEEAIAGALACDREARVPTVAAFAAAIAGCGSDAARASLLRIERIAARLPPAGELTEEAAGDTTVPQDPPSSVVRAMEAPGDITQPPALGQSVDAPAPGRAPLSPLARLGLVGVAAGLLVAGTVIGVQRMSGSPAAPVAGVASVEAHATPSADAGEPRWQATPLAVKGLDLGNFAVAQPPGHDHPQGVIAALGFAPSAGDQTAITLSALDVENGREIVRNLIGYGTGDIPVRITATPRGVLVAHQRESELQLQWYADGTTDAATSTLPQLGSKTGKRLRGVVALGDRVVLATSSVGITSVWILDGAGKLLSSFPCHGGLPGSSDAELVQMGDDVLVSNFAVKEHDGVPVCAGRLHGTPRWREVTLRGGTLEVGVGGVYFRPSGSADPASIHALDENLQPTGLPPPPARTPLRTGPCEGLTGSMVQHVEELAGQEIVDMVACCGDEGGGLFVCRPPKKGP